MRVENSVFRLGGDEFAILIPGEDRDGADAIAKRIDAAVRDDPRCRGVGVSWGVSELSDGDPAGLVADADAALYEARRAVAGPSR